MIGSINAANEPPFGGIQRWDLTKTIYSSIPRGFTTMLL